MCYINSGSMRCIYQFPWLFVWNFDLLLPFPFPLSRLLFLFSRFQMLELSWQNIDTGIWRFCKIDTLFCKTDTSGLLITSSAHSHFNQVRPLSRPRGHLLYFSLRNWKKHKKKEKENERDRHIKYMYKLYFWYIYQEVIFIYIRKDKVKYLHIVSGSELDICLYFTPGLANFFLTVTAVNILGFVKWGKIQDTT